MEPKVKALRLIKYALDSIEELRHLSPERNNEFKTHSGKLAHPGIKGGDFNNILKKIESKGIAKFSERPANAMNRWGENILSITAIDWAKFDRYCKEVDSEYSKATKKDSRAKNNLIVTNSSKSKEKSTIKRFLNNAYIRGIIVVVVGGFLLSISISPNPKLEVDIGDDAKIEKSLIALDSPGASLTINENKSADDNIIRDIKFKIILDIPLVEGASFKEKKDFGLANAVALFSKDEIRYRFVSDYKLSWSRSESSLQRLELNYAPETPEQILGKDVTILKDIRTLKVNFSEIIKTTNLKIDRDKLAIFKWTIFLNGIPRLINDSEVLGSVLTDGQAKLEIPNL